MFHGLQSEQMIFICCLDGICCFYYVVIVVPHQHATRLASQTAFT